MDLHQQLKVGTLFTLGLGEGAVGIEKAYEWGHANLKCVSKL